MFITLQTTLIYLRTFNNTPHTFTGQGSLYAGITEYINGVVKGLHPPVHDSAPVQVSRGFNVSFSLELWKDARQCSYITKLDWNYINSFKETIKQIMLDTL